VARQQCFSSLLAIAGSRSILNAMGVVKTAQRLTESEYLALERRAEFKSEFFDGEMFAMAGGTRLHSLISTNLAREFGNRLEGRPCVPYNSRLAFEGRGHGTLHLS
jgi:Uma2 family endonuclease